MEDHCSRSHRRLLILVEPGIVTEQFFIHEPGRAILRIPEKGGDPVEVTRFQAPQQASHGFPQILPDGRHFIYFVTGSPESRGMYLGQLDNLESRRLFDSEDDAAFSPTGHLLFSRQGALMAQGFDADRLELKGSAFPVVDHLGALGSLSISSPGSIVYRATPAGAQQQQFLWVDRSGNEVNKFVYPETAGITPDLSHDGRAIASLSYRESNMDIWTFETSRRAWNRITFDNADDILPLWSPDGLSIIFSSNRAGLMSIYRKQLKDAPGSEELILSAPPILFPMDWSLDGQYLLYDATDSKTGDSDIRALPLKGKDAKPIELVHTKYSERSAQFSPDRHWFAYQSDRSGKMEIYVQPFPAPARAYSFLPMAAYSHAGTPMVRSCFTSQRTES